MSAAQVASGIELLNTRKAMLHTGMDAELYLQRLYLDFLAAIDLREEGVDGDSTVARGGEVAYYNFRPPDLGRFYLILKLRYRHAMLSRKCCDINEISKYARCNS